MKLIPIFLWACALALCAWLLRDFPLAVAIASVQNISTLQCLIWLALNIGILYLSSLRWQFLAKSVACRLNLWVLFLIRMGGQTISFLTPGPQFGGEPVQIYWLVSRFNAPLKQAILALGLDRLYELWVNFFVLLTGLLIILNAYQWAADTFFIPTQTVVILLISLLLLPLLVYRYRSGIHKKITGTLQRYLSNTVKNANLSMSVTPNEQAKISLGLNHLIALGVSILVWAGIFLELQLIVAILNIELGSIEVMTLLCFIRLAMLLPLPGGIGSIEAAIILFFQVMSLDIEMAFAVIALCRLRDVMLLLLGLGCLYTVQNKPKSQTNQTKSFVRTPPSK